MANWKHKIQIWDLYDRYDRNEIDVPTLGKLLAERLEKVAEEMPSSWQKELGSIATSLEEVNSVDEYDSCLEALYDWGDQDHRLWVNCFRES